MCTHFRYVENGTWCSTTGFFRWWGAGPYKSQPAWLLVPAFSPSPAFEGQAGLKVLVLVQLPWTLLRFWSVYTSVCHSLDDPFHLGTLYLPPAFFHRHGWKLVYLQRSKWTIDIFVVPAQLLRTRVAASVPEGFPRTFSIFSFRDTICFSNWSFSSSWVSYRHFHSLTEGKGGGGKITPMPRICSARKVPDVQHEDLVRISAHT